MIKKFYKIEFENDTPINISGANNDYTDKDLIRDGRGNPYIPGTSLAGIYRSLFNKEDADKYFGSAAGENNKDSKIITYDATITSKDIKISIRDMVAIDEKYGVAIDGAKFDFEILLPNHHFITYLEVNDGDDVGDKIASFYLNNQIIIGSKTTRGLGRLKNINVKRVIFNLPNDKEQYLDFDIYQNNWENSEEINKIETKIEKYIEYNLELKLISSIIVREYTTDVDSFDYTYLSNENGGAIIPGTSWAGVFRHQMKKIGDIKDDGIDKVFGKENKNNHTKSKILFSESNVKGGIAKEYTRNAIDRFSGGTVNSALFKERFYYGGNTTLNIKVDKNIENYDGFISLLCAAICDLHYGLLAIGGETSVGRGLFEITKVNDKEIEDNIDSEKLYSILMEVAK